LAPADWFMMRVLTTSKGVDTLADTSPDTNAPTTWLTRPSLRPVSRSVICFVWS
jgi:hypothetical protein